MRVWGSVRRFAPLALLALLGFVATAALIRTQLPDPFLLPAEYRSDKLALIDQWRSRANVAAFGSSRMHEGFLPEIFDAQFGPSFASTSLNLGIVAGSLNEQRAMARRFLERKRPTGPCPTLILLEMNAGLNLPPETRFDPRTVNLYDADSLNFVANFEDPGIGILRRIGRITFALSAAAAHYANAGMLSAVLFPVEHAVADEDARGRIGLPQTEDEAERVATLFAARPAESKVVPVSLGQGYRRLLDNIASPHAHYLYVVAPMLDDMSDIPDYPAAIEGPNGPVPIFNLARPDRFPELYRLENWRNATHMTHEGAAVFSRLLGMQVADWAAHQSFPAECGK